MELKSDEVMDRTYIITLKSNNKSDNISSVKNLLFKYNSDILTPGELCERNYLNQEEKEVVRFEVKY